MAFYRSELSAIVCGVNAGMIPNYSIQAWQGQYKSGFVEDLTKKHSDIERLSKTDRMTQDSITRARIKRNDKRGGYYVLVAKYGIDEQERVNAVHELVKMCDVNCSEDGKKFLIGLWAINSKQRKGIVGQALDLFNGVCERTFFYKKKQVFDWLNELEGLAISEAKEVLAGVL